MKVVDFAGDDPRDLEKQTRLLDLFTSAMIEATQEIESGRYAAVPDVEAAIRQKLNFVLMRSLNAATQPTTLPTTPSPTKPAG